MIKVVEKLFGNLFLFWSLFFQRIFSVVFVSLSQCGEVNCSVSVEDYKKCCYCSSVTSGFSGVAVTAQLTQGFCLSPVEVSR